MPCYYDTLYLLARSVARPCHPHRASISSFSLLLVQMWMSFFRIYWFSLLRPLFPPFLPLSCAHPVTATGCIHFLFSLSILNCKFLLQGLFHICNFSISHKVGLSKILCTEMNTWLNWWMKVHSHQCSSKSCLVLFGEGHLSLGYVVFWNYLIFKGVPASILNFLYQNLQYFQNEMLELKANWK